MKTLITPRATGLTARVPDADVERWLAAGWIDPDAAPEETSLFDADPLDATDAASTNDKE